MFKIKAVLIKFNKDPGYHNLQQYSIFYENWKFFKYL